MTELRFLSSKRIGLPAASSNFQSEMAGGDECSFEENGLQGFALNHRLQV